ncbi:MAG: LptA/OstA family protein [Verrucomicrobiales bacterium]|nr:LptA/OstA family protein [Verrucomicrobiales bacterium]
MRLLSFITVLLSLALASCASFNRSFSAGYSIEADDVVLRKTPEEKGANYVDMSGWHLEGNAISVTRDQTKRQVLRASAQGGATLTSTQVPLHSRVNTVGRAQAIYYDAFHDRFELIGDPIVEQGAKVTSKYGPDESILLYVDGRILETKVETLVPDAGL